MDLLISWCTLLPTDLKVSIFVRDFFTVFYFFVSVLPRVIVIFAPFNPLIFLHRIFFKSRLILYNTAVTKPLLETSRSGYLAASSASAYSLVSMVSRFGPIMNPGGSVISLTYMASEKVIPGYGGGMSSAKAALESDTRVLAYEAGRKHGIRVNTISAGPLASRAAKAIGGAGKPKTFIDYAIDYSKANAPMAQDLYSDDVGASAAFLLSPLARAVTGITMYVDNGLTQMGLALDAKSMEQVDEE